MRWPLGSMESLKRGGIGGIAAYRCDYSTEEEVELKGFENKKLFFVG